MRQLTCGRMFNKLLFYTSTVKYIVLTSWPSNVKFRGHLYPPPIMAQFATMYSLDRFILSQLSGKKLQILQHFLWHPVVAPTSSAETKLNMGAQLQNFPYPNMSKTLLSSNAFWAKSFSQTVVHEHNGQTRDRQKTQNFWFPQWLAKSEPHYTWHGDRGPRARSCISKTFQGPTQFRHYGALKLWG